MYMYKTKDVSYFSAIRSWLSREPALWGIEKMAIYVVACFMLI